MVGTKEMRICLFNLIVELMLYNENSMCHSVFPGVCTVVLAELKFNKED